VIDYNAVGNPFTIAVTTSTAPSFTLANTGTPAAGNVASNTNNVVLYGFALTSAACTGTYNFTACDIQKAGTSTTADLSNFRLIVDADNDGVADPGEISSPIGTVAVLANPLAFTVSGQTGLSGVRRYLLIADVASGATSGRTFTASLPNANVTAGVTVTGSANGTTQTVLAACATPNAVTDIALTPTDISVSGTITPPSGGATGYLVIRNPNAILSTTPSTGATYSVGAAFGTGTVVAYGTSTTFSGAGLSSSTTYHYFVFAYNNTSCGGGPVYASGYSESTTTLAGPCLGENFDAATTLPSGWSSTGSNWTSSSHYSSAPNCRSLGASAELITSTVNYPSSISFYVDASSSGGQIGTLQYRVGAGAWTTVGTFTASTTGATETFALTSAPNLISSANVSFRISSAGNTIYIDDMEVFCASAQPFDRPDNQYDIWNRSRGPPI
jgi:hypothetical protein